MERFFMGIDVSKDRLDVHVRPTGESFVVAGDEGGIAALLTRLAGWAPTLVVHGGGSLQPADRRGLRSVDGGMGALRLTDAPR